MTSVRLFVSCAALMMTACGAAPAYLEASPEGLGQETVTEPVLGSTRLEQGASDVDTISQTRDRDIDADDIMPPPRDGFTVAARSDGALDVYEEPHSDTPWLTLPGQTDLGTPRVVLVVGAPVDGWLEVALPIRPNGSTGWIRSEQVSLFEVDRRVHVDLSDHRLSVHGPDGLLLETTVAVGGPGSPTPVGSFFVTDSVLLTDPTGPWGPHAFGLSAYSDTITEFNGGNGIIGIHGTNRPDSIGSNRSLGCVRVPNDVATKLAEMVSAGVPVEIVR